MGERRRAIPVDYLRNGKNKFLFIGNGKELYFIVLLIRQQGIVEFDQLLFISIGSINIAMFITNDQFVIVEPNECIGSLKENRKTTAFDQLCPVTSPYLNTKRSIVSVHLLFVDSTWLSSPPVCHRSTKK